MAGRHSGFLVNSCKPVQAKIQAVDTDVGVRSLTWHVDVLVMC